MYLLVYTLSLRVGVLQVDCKFYHSLFFNEGPKLCLLRKQFAFKRINKGVCSNDLFNFNSIKHINRKKPKISRNLRVINLKKKVLKKISNHHQADVVTSGNILQVKDESSPVLNVHNEINSSPNSPIQKTNTNVDNAVCSGNNFDASWSPQQLSIWLQANRYNSHLTTFSSYSGVDLLRLTKDNLIQLCGLPDGLRLHNALHSRTAVLTLYICIDMRDEVYQAVYLSKCTCTELIRKMSAALGLHVPQIAAVYVRGPNNIKIILTDELVTHLPDHSAYIISVLQDGPDRYQILLKSSEQRGTTESRI